MQEEVTNRSINLAITTSKLTARTIMNGLRMYLNHRTKVKAKKAAAKNEVPRGKQTVGQLIGQNQGVTSIPIASTELKGFERVAKKYGVDFAIRKDAFAEPPRYTVFFKARDEAALEAAYLSRCSDKKTRVKTLLVFLVIKIGNCIYAILPTGFLKAQHFISIRSHGLIQYILLFILWEKGQERQLRIQNQISTTLSCILQSR